MMRIPRDYQSECVASIDREFANVNSTLAVMATGLGKTVVMSEVAKRRSEEGAVLMLALDCLPAADAALALRDAQRCLRAAQDALQLALAQRRDLHSPISDGRPRLLPLLNEQSLYGANNLEKSEKKSWF